MSKTNSNSITSILIYALNNKQSGFREAMLKRIREDYPTKTISEDIIFSDGTHTSLPLQDLAGTKPDIYGMKNGSLELIIEVKASLGETLQNAQKAGGEYETTANNLNIPLLFIIPKKYNHEKELPKKTEIVDIIYWTEICKIARKFDSIGLEPLINNFVEIIDDENIINKNEIALLFIPDLIKETYEKLETFLEKIRNFLGWTTRKEPQEDQYGIGYDFKDNDNYWIGLLPSLDNKFFFSLAINKNQGNKLDNNDVHFDGEYYYIPCNDQEAQNIMNNQLNKQLFISNSLKAWLQDAQKHATEIKAVYGLSDKVLSLVENYLKNTRGEKGERQRDKEGIGCFFNNENYFLGINPSLNKIESDYCFSLAIHKEAIKEDFKKNPILESGEEIIAKKDYVTIKDKKGNEKNKYDSWFYFSLSSEKELFYKFLLSETPEEQQKNFNELVDKILDDARLFLE